MLCAAASAAHAAPSPAAAPAPTPAAATSPPGWKQLFENSQNIYYMGANLARPADPAAKMEVTLLVEFKIAQVLDGAQAWSAVSRLQLDCAQGRMITLNDTYYASKLGQGPAVSSHGGVDVWHAPQPGSLSQLIWSSACPKPSAAAAPNQVPASPPAPTPGASKAPTGEAVRTSPFGARRRPARSFSGRSSWAGPQASGSLCRHRRGP